jgi:predicted TIM-barrel fold metal-dependent hydrolase
MEFTCAPANAVTHPPRRRAPPGACDSHFHIFGPYDRFPLSATRPYTPPPATIPHYLSMANTLGLTRRVVVQASVSGTDNEVTLDAVARLGEARAVCVVDDGFDDAALRRLGERGTVGLRFNAVSGNGTPVEQLEALAKRAADQGWHIQIFARHAALAEMLPRLMTLPAPLVLDHMGGADARDPSSLEPTLRLLEAGRAWVKLCGYRASRPPYGDLGPLARRLVAAAPERCVWGTDWPHTQFATPEEMLDDGMLLDWLEDWVPEEAQRHAILVDNPARLYRFD